MTEKKPDVDPEPKATLEEYEKFQKSFASVQVEPFRAAMQDLYVTVLERAKAQGLHVVSLRMDPERWEVELMDANAHSITVGGYTQRLTQKQGTSVTVTRPSR